MIASVVLSAPMEVRAASGVINNSAPQSSRLGLDSKQRAIFTNDYVVAMILTKWNRDLISALNQRSDYRTFGYIPDQLCVSLFFSSCDDITGKECHLYGTTRVNSTFRRMKRSDPASLLREARLHNIPPRL